MVALATLIDHTTKKMKFLGNKNLQVRAEMWKISDKSNENFNILRSIVLRTGQPLPGQLVIIIKIKRQKKKTKN